MYFKKIAICCIGILNAWNFNHVNSAKKHKNMREGQQRKARKPGRGLGMQGIDSQAKAS